LNHGWKVRPEGPAAIPREPREYARRLYFDSLTLSAANLRFIVEQFGAERVVIGSDYPFDMGADDPVGALAEANLSAADRAEIEGGAATRFLGL
jgi:aminocarboxymuconate-semialdehyde decarboxylase